MKTNKYMLMYLAGSVALFSGAKWAFVTLLRKAKAETEFTETALQTWESEGGLVVD